MFETVGTREADNKMILVVEDSPTQALHLQALLEQEGYRVLTACDGQEALEVMGKNLPDLILADVIMPRMDGYTLFEKIHQHPYWKAIPFIFVTAKGTEEDIRLGRELGSDDYVIKPFEIGDLALIIRTRLKRKEEIEEVWLGRIKELNEHLAHTQHLAALGLLSTRFAHEIGNILTNVAGYATILHKQLERGQVSSEDLSQLIAQAEWAVSLARSTLNFSRPKKASDCVAVVTEAVDRSLSLLEYRLRENQIKLKKDYPSSNLPPVEVDPNELEQVILNLLLNAVQAMPEGGELEIKARPAEKDLRLEIRDTGIGIPPENLGRIFDLFFTTKEDSGGTGLGLYICRYIVEKYGGSIEVESRLGEGTAFYLTLPLSTNVGRGGKPPLLLRSDVLSAIG